VTGLRVAAWSAVVVRGCDRGCDRVRGRTAAALVRRGIGWPVVRDGVRCRPDRCSGSRGSADRR
jgi:hypothetical protein